jgi:protease IV
MKQFFKFMFASCLGIFLFIVVISIVGSIIGARAIGQSQDGEELKPNTILSLTLDDLLPEQTNNVEVNPFDFDQEAVVGLQDMVAAIERAKKDKNIKGIYLNLSEPQVGFATMSVLRRALLEFKKDNDKQFVVAYADNYSQKSYYLASVADEIYLNPIGTVDFRGLSATVLFFKDMLDRLGVDMQVFYVGDFKSATEPLRRTNMSEASREQTREYIDGLYNLMLKDISTARKIPVSQLRTIADEYKLEDAKDAVAYKFVDKLLYKDELIDLLKDKIGLDKKEDLTLMEVNTYHKANPKEMNLKAKNKIAVIYAEGSIVDGEGQVGEIGGDKYSRIIREIRADKKVKAIVLRVNSGGGSGFASEKIWRELTLAREQGIPVYVSFGDVAASGGYYIACMADGIYAEPNSITGSIGVFGVIPSMEKFFKNKVGITVDTVKTGKFSNGITPFYNVNEAEGKIIQASVEDFYRLFLQRVADGRGMDTAAVHQIAQGRVWTGTKALDLKLIDGFDDLNGTIAKAAKKAGVEDYRIAEYPTIKEPFQQILDEIMGKKDKTAKVSEMLVKEELGDLYPFYNEMKTIRQMKGIQARMPFFMTVE